MYYYPVPSVDDIHEEDGCDLCHATHEASGDVLDSCETCQSLKCPTCNGTAHIIDGDTDCPDCLGGGRKLSAHQKYILQRNAKLVL